MDFTRASDALESIGTSDRKLEGLKPGENRAAIYSLLAWVLCFIGCGLLVISVSQGEALFVIGMVILIAGILFGISSRNMKKKIEKK